jgi:putative hydrolase of HD superfamily
MNIETVQGRLAFLRESERLKSVLRSAHTSSGRQESTAEHSWRLSLMAMVFADELKGLDLLKVLKLCLVHDLGEAISGDIPAVNKRDFPDKSEQERADLLHLTRTLDKALQEEILALWEDYENAASAEALAVKALDKLETILQHNQGINPPDFDYAFNLTYGIQYTKATALFDTLRTLINQDTREKLNMNLKIRNEQPEDIERITALTVAAFEQEEHSSHTEHLIVDALRRAGKLTVSLVALDHDEIVGHVAISPVTVSSGAKGWYGLGPISVWPNRQGQGIGSTLMKAALAELKGQGATGCVVLGDPGFYGRFGFKAHIGLELPGIPHEYFQALSFSGDLPAGTVQYHESFDSPE